MYLQTIFPVVMVIAQFNIVQRVGLLARTIERCSCHPRLVALHYLHVVPSTTAERAVPALKFDPHRYRILDVLRYPIDLAASLGDQIVILRRGCLFGFRSDANVRRTCKMRFLFTPGDDDRERLICTVANELRVVGDSRINTLQLIVYALLDRVVVDLFFLESAVLSYSHVQHTAPSDRSRICKRYNCIDAVIYIADRLPFNEVVFFITQTSKQNPRPFANCSSNDPSSCFLNNGRIPRKRCGSPPLYPSNAIGCGDRGRMDGILTSRPQSTRDRDNREPGSARCIRYGSFTSSA